MGIRQAIVDNGYRLIDTAKIYETEEIIGEVLQEIFSEGKIKREDLFITTKLWPSDKDKVEETLR
jgi:D-arabinose 1-dehydrogenase